jgi:hypothetical protein
VAVCHFNVRTWLASAPARRALARASSDSRQADNVEVESDAVVGRGSCPVYAGSPRQVCCHAFGVAVLGGLRMRTRRPG